MLIEVDRLTKTYRDGLFRRRRIEALRGVSFAVERGEIVGLLGPNGAGKTTIIKVLLGVVRKSGGTAKLLGYAAGDRRGRRDVGYLPENHRIPRHHTAHTALEYYGGLSGLSAREVRARRENLLEDVGLGAWGKVSVRKFSKGMLQRLGLAQALLNDPQLLILDEPTDGVDPVGRSEMRALLSRLRAVGKTIFINSHLLQEIELVCDRVLILNHGLLLREAQVADLTRQSQTEVQLTLRGGRETILAVLENHPAGRLTTIEEEVHQVAVLGQDQGAIDRLVDDLRRAGISIVSLAPQTRTLEEAFLDILQEAKIVA